MHDKKKRRMVFHVNMVREFQVHKFAGSNYFADRVFEENEVEEAIL